MGANPLFLARRREGLRSRPANAGAIPSRPPESFLLERLPTTRQSPRPHRAAGGSMGVTPDVYPPNHLSPPAPNPHATRSAARHQIWTSGTRHVMPLALHHQWPRRYLQPSSPFDVALICDTEHGMASACCMQANLEHHISPIGVPGSSLPPHSSVYPYLT